MAENYVDKIKKGEEEFEIHDSRLPAAPVCWYDDDFEMIDDEILNNCKAGDILIINNSLEYLVAYKDNSEIRFTAEDTNYHYTLIYVKNGNSYEYYTITSKSFGGTVLYKHEVTFDYNSNQIELVIISYRDEPIDDFDSFQDLLRKRVAMLQGYYTVYISDDEEIILPTTGVIAPMSYVALSNFNDVVEEL